MNAIASIRATAPRTLWALTGLSVAVLAATILRSLTDPRLIAGVPTWDKPQKFALSFVVFFGTLALVEDRLSPDVRDSLTLRAVRQVFVVAFVAETAYITIQAAKAEASHFNLTTPFTTIAYTLMGIGAVTLVLGVAIYGWIAWRDRRADFGPGLRLGVAAGFAVSTVLTLITAGTLSSVGGHFIGTPSADAMTIPFLGWSAEVGDLRPPHFLALHAMQAGPVWGLIVDRLGLRAGPVVLAGVALWTALTLAVFGQALAGLPLVAL